MLIKFGSILTLKFLNRMYWSLTFKIYIQKLLVKKQSIILSVNIYNKKHCSGILAKQQKLTLHSISENLMSQK